MTDIFYTLEELSKLLKVSKMTLYRYIKSGKLPAYKLWKEIRVKITEYNTFLERSRFVTKQNNGSKK